MKTSTGNLTTRGKLFFREFSPTKSLSKFSSKQRLIQSDAYKQLPSPVQRSLADFWDTTNSLSVNGIGENAGSIETFFFWDADSIDGNAYNSLYSVLI